MSEPNLHVLIRETKWLQVTARTAENPMEVQSWYHGELPIHVACQQGCAPLNVIQTLIQSYPDSLAQLSSSHYNALHYAVMSPSNSSNDMLVLVELLLSHYKEGASVTDHHGLTPLSAYLHYGIHPSLKFVMVLVEAYPQAICRCTHFQFYPLHYAAFRGKQDIAEYILELYPQAFTRRTSHNISLDILQNCMSAQIPAGSTPTDIARIRSYAVLNHYPQTLSSAKNTTKNGEIHVPQKDTVLTKAGSQLFPALVSQEECHDDDYLREDISLSEDSIEDWQIGTLIQEQLHMDAKFDKVPLMMLGLKCLPEYFSPINDDIQQYL